MSFTPASKALARFKVLDLTRVRAGPTAARQLADWGADVIKIELPKGLDESDMGGPRHGPDFQNLHRNKRSLTLNLKEPDGIAIFKKMVATADVVIENYRPDVKFRLGIDYETLRAVNKRIVYGSISGFGEDGPYRERPGFGAQRALLSAPAGAAARLARCRCLGRSTDRGRREALYCPRSAGAAGDGGRQYQIRSHAAARHTCARGAVACALRRRASGVGGGQHPCR